jgi:hypothetical protein
MFGMMPSVPGAAQSSFGRLPAHGFVLPSAAGLEWGQRIDATADLFCGCVKFCPLPSSGGILNEYDHAA